MKLFLPTCRSTMQIVTLIAVMLCSFCCPPAHGQSNIILRDLSLIEGREITSFDFQSIKLDDNTQLGWDQVFRATVQPERQAEFDKNIKELGLPLFRLRQRIAIGDWNRLNEIADRLMVRYSGVDSPTGKTVCIATMKGRLETRSRAAAVLPFLMACAKSAELSPQTLEAIGITNAELQSGISNQILPVWFDLRAVEKQKDAIVAYSQEPGVTLPPGGNIYLASFCIALEQWDQAKQYLDQIDSNADTQPWKQLLLAEVKHRQNGATGGISGHRVKPETLPAIVAVGQFWEAENSARDTAADPAAKILNYLKVSALWGEQFPTLSSASLYRAILLAKSSNMTGEAETLAAELLRSHRNSYHERLLKFKK